MVNVNYSQIRGNVRREGHVGGYQGHVITNVGGRGHNTGRWIFFRRSNFTGRGYEAKNYGLRFIRDDDMKLTKFTNVDWACDLNGRKSVGAYCIN